MYPTPEEMLWDIRQRVYLLLNPAFRDLSEFTMRMSRLTGIRHPEWMKHVR